MPDLDGGASRSHVRTAVEIGPALRQALDPVLA